MYMALVSLGNPLLFVTPSAVELSVCRSERVWGQPISMRVWQGRGICLALMKCPASSNFSTEDMTDLMIWERVRSGTVLSGMGMSSERKIWTPDRLRDLLSLRKGASEFPARTMLLGR